MKTRKWTDKEGLERYTTEIIASDMTMLGSREGGGMGSMDEAGGGGGGAPAPRPMPARQAPASKPAPAGNKSSTGFDDMDNDIPF